MRNYSINKQVKRILTGILTIIMVFVSIDLSQFVSAQAATEYDILYLIDNTAEKWVKNDNAKIKAIDNSNGHTAYWMTQKNETTWSVKVPKNAYNITFNRYAEDKTTQWNSWSAGGRDKNNAYYVDGSEYGHWGIKDGDEEYFHAGDIIYLDVSEFTQWEKDDAVMYINFTDATKDENDINIFTADKTLYKPQQVSEKIDKYIYTYTVTEEDNKATDLRFWRGNENTLWNCSVNLSISKYREGYNCVKITDWNESGYLKQSSYKVDYEKDSDLDGLSDYIEVNYGLDKDNSDSDLDGLPDEFELNQCGTSPISIDTDNNGILDVDEDMDNDKVSNLQEYQNGTNPMLSDTDDDGLSDYEEINIYMTNPTLPDTDNDGLSDYDDVNLGFDPLYPDTNNNGILDGEEKIEQSVSKQIEQVEANQVKEVIVDMKTNGNIEKSVYISNMYNIDKLSSDVVGLIGVPVEITCNSEFDEATITFKYDKNLLGETKEENLSVMWYDKENNWYQILDTDSVIDTSNQTVSYKTTHFSTYMLVDKKIWYDTWKENIDYRSSGVMKNYNFAFVVDVSGSMDGDRIYTAKKALTNFVDLINVDDRGCLIQFNTVATVLNDFESNNSLLKMCIQNLIARGGTNVNAGLVKAIEQYDKLKSDNQNIILLICDGDVNYQEDTIKEAKRRNINIYTINVGSRSSDYYLRKIADETGGEYYYCSTAEEIETVFAEIENGTVENIDTTDTDGDGLYDVYETAGFRLSNGRLIKTDPNNVDTDGDKLTDYDEIGFIYNIDIPLVPNWLGNTPTFKSITQYIGNNETKLVKYVLLYSDPTKIDSDGDKVDDYNDTKPWIYNIGNICIYKTFRQKGIDEKGNIAADMMVNDYSKEKILDIHKYFSYQIYEAENTPEYLFDEFRSMSTRLFSKGKLSKVIVEMIEHFEEGTGSDYSNDVLTEKVSQHNSTKAYVKKIKEEVVSRLNKNGGNIYNLEFTGHDLKEKKGTIQAAINNTTKPCFNTWKDKIDGLTICVNDTWGNNVEIVDYEFDGVYFNGKIKVTIFDHFGLDQPDVEKIYADLAGFRAWFVLQHYDYFGGKYKPFASIMEVEVPFEGRIQTWEPAK